jgi:hypothetical protein
MGRPLNKKYFGNRNIGSASVTTDDGIGGKGIASVTIAGSWSGFTQATSTVTFSAPQLPGGVTATGTVTITAGAPASVTMTEKGSGYTSLPTVTIADSDVGAETSGTATAVFEVDTGNVGSVTNEENAILMTAYLTGGSALSVDIKKQVSTNRFKVTDGTRTGIVKLTGSLADAAGEGSVRLLDTDGGTYFATKITSRKAVITRGTGTQTAFVTGTSVKWNMTAATADSLLIDNA